jgi:hypothetical protein
MTTWLSLYERPTPIKDTWGHHRIFAPASYRRLRNLPLVPVVHTEAMTLARFFPICWAATGSGLVLSALRSLTDDALGMPPIARTPVAALPQVLQAYPFVVPESAAAMDGALLADRVIAEDPTDIGAPILMANGKLSRAAAARTRLALKLGRTLVATRTLGGTLSDAGLLEPWPLQFDLGSGRSVDIGTLSVVSRSRLDDPALHALVLDHGVDAGLFISAHRMSLFRVPALLAAAKAAVGAAPLLAKVA